MTFKSLSGFLVAYRYSIEGEKVLSMPLKIFTFRDVDLQKHLYISLVRPHLEFASSVWNPYSQGDICILQAVPQQAQPTAATSLLQKLFTITSNSMKNISELLLYIIVYLENYQILIFDQRRGLIVYFRLNILNLNFR